MIFNLTDHQRVLTIIVFGLQLRQEEMSSNINAKPKLSFSSLLDLGKKKNKDLDEEVVREELEMNEVPELIQLTKDVIILLDDHKDQLDVIPGLIHELMNFGKTFTKIDVKINEYPDMQYMTPAHLKEANSCLSLLKETLLQIQREVNQYAEHQKPDKLTNKIWMTFNRSQIISNFKKFQEQVKDHCDLLLTNFLPILSTIVSNVTDKDQVKQSMHSLSATDKSKICGLIMKEKYIMKLYVPKGSATRPGQSGVPTTSPIMTATATPPKVATGDPVSVTKSATPNDSAEMITLKKQSSASRFLIEQKASKSSVHHEASDLKEEVVKPKEEKISAIRNLSFNLFDAKKGSGSTSRSPSFSTIDAVKGGGGGTPATQKPGEDPEFDVLPDYYHIKWLSVLPVIWKDYPNLTFGQIKYIYLSQNFFSTYHNDMYFVNNKTVDEVYKLQQYLEAAREIACFTQEDFLFVAATISNNKDLTMRQLIPLLHERFQGTREFTFLTLMGSELFCTKVKASEQVLLDVVHQFPEEEAKWPIGDVNLDWTVLHAVQKKHEKSKLKSVSKSKPTA